MRLRDAIGIDPDSRGFICAAVRLSGAPVTTKGYMATDVDLKAFLRWVKSQGDVIVAIEGTNGFSRPLEKALRAAGIIFYSFKPADTNAFRKAVLGQNKDNRKDAESVARYAMALEAQGKLERYRRVWFADAELQLLTRSCERKSQAMTAETNRLWKLHRLACPGLYLALGGSHPEVQVSENILKSQGILTLLSNKPQLGEWKQLTEEQLLEAMGGGKYKGRKKLIEAASQTYPQPPSDLSGHGSFDPKQRPTDPAAQDRASRDHQDVGGAHPPECSGTAPEADPRYRHPQRSDHDRRDHRHPPLPTRGQSGLLQRTGDDRAFHRDSFKMVPMQLFNHRLKDAFMTAARNFVQYNPDSHPAGYHRNLVKRRMSSMEATKRVARALVRVIYRMLCALPSQQTGTPGETDQKKEGEGEMASGLIRSDQRHKSNISPSSLRTIKARGTKGVKRATARTVRNRSRGRKGVSKQTV